VRMPRVSRNFRNKSENACSSCITRIISDRSTLIAVHAVIAVAVARCRSPTEAIDSSPTKSPAQTMAIVASLPSFDTAVSFARFPDNRRWPQPGLPARRKHLLPLNERSFDPDPYSPGIRSDQMRFCLARSSEWFMLIRRSLRTYAGRITCRLADIR
jgi:hypothetical protein